MQVLIPKVTELWVGEYNEDEIYGVCSVAKLIEFNVKWIEKRNVAKYIRSKILSEIQWGDRQEKIILKNWHGNTQGNGTHVMLNELGKNHRKLYTS